MTEPALFAHSKFRKAGEGAALGRQESLSAKQRPDDVLRSLRRWLSIGTVWATFAICSAVAVWFVSTYAVNVPFADEWQFPPFMAGRYPVTLGWLWSPHNEHRIPLTRALYLLSAHIGGNDFRSGAWLNIALLISLAAFLIMVARRLRGETRVTDAFFPLVVLHLAHAENMLWGMEIGFVCSPLLLAIMLGMILTQPQGLTNLRSLIVAVLCLAGLTLCGSHGVILVPFLSLWLILAGVARRRTASSETRRWDAGSLGSIMSGIAGFGLTALYFYGLGALSSHTTRPGLQEAISTAGQFLAMAWSRQLANYWPWSGFVVPIMLVAAGACLLYVWMRKPAELIRAEGLLLIAGGLATLAAAIGWGRANLGFGSGFTLRYATIAMPALWLAYFVAVAYTAGRLRNLLQWGLLLTVGWMYYWNYYEGVGYGESRRRAGLVLEQDLRAGISAGELADRNAGQFFTRPVSLARDTLFFRTLNVGPFQPAAVDANLQFLELPIEPIRHQQMEWNNPHGRTIGDVSGLTFRLDQPRLVRRIYISLRQTGSEPLKVPVRLVWAGRGKRLGYDLQDPVPGISPRDSSNVRSFESSEATASQNYEFTFTVDAMIEEFGLQFGRAECEFTIDKISALAKLP